MLGPTMLLQYSKSVCVPQATALFLLFDCTDGNDSLTKVRLDRNESMIITFGTSSHYTENKFC